VIRPLYAAAKSKGIAVPAGDATICSA